MNVRSDIVLNSLFFVVSNFESSRSLLFAPCYVAIIFEHSLIFQYSSTQFAGILCILTLISFEIVVIRSCKFSYVEVRARGGGGGGVLTPNFGRYVPRQSDKWARAPGPGSGTSSRSSVKNAGLRNELEPFWAWKMRGSGTNWSVLSVKMRLSGTASQDASGWRSGRLLTRGAAERFAFGLSRPWEAMNGLKLKKFWKWCPMMVSGTAKSAKKCKMVMLRNGFYGNLWKWYAPERKFRAENGGSLARHIPNMHTYGIPPRPPPPRGGGGAMTYVVTWTVPLITNWQRMKHQ